MSQGERMHFEPKEGKHSALRHAAPAPPRLGELATEEGGAEEVTGESLASADPHTPPTGKIGQGIWGWGESEGFEKSGGDLSRLEGEVM